MTSSEIVIRKAEHSDTGNLKALADAHKNELGFILRSTLAKSVDSQCAFIAISPISDVTVGFIDYHHRRDVQTTLYHIVVASDHQGDGIGRKLVEALKNEAVILGKQRIILRCPEDLPANTFYHCLGFRLVATESGKTRRLNVWQLDLVPDAMPSRTVTPPPIAD